MTWSSTEIRMCCRSRGVGSGSSAIPDDYRRFWTAVNAICVKTARSQTGEVMSGARPNPRRIGVRGSAGSTAEVGLRGPTRLIERDGRRQIDHAASQPRQPWTASTAADISADGQRSRIAAATTPLPFRPSRGHESSSSGARPTGRGLRQLLRRQRWESRIIHRTSFTTNTRGGGGRWAHASNALSLGLGCSKDLQQTPRCGGRGGKLHRWIATRSRMDTYPYITEHTGLRDHYRHIS
jgi:hypothetical protein